MKPTCFLDDITTKNVIINNGVLSGIVDVDSLAFGDSLLTVALTKVSLLSSGYDTEYTDYWTERLDLDTKQKKALDLYSAIFCLDFLSEEGQVFNKKKSTNVNSKRVNVLINLLNKILISI